ncbi:MAG: SRPBCC family protein [Ignavibacteria bacterium]|nr:SRPBCC family protein [Ignavibacteria bacterium]
MLHTLHRIQRAPLSIEKAWDFLSSPQNLKVITPEYMGFHILSDSLPEKMYAGLIIPYIVRPVMKLPIQWVTEITHVHEPHYFVDEQRFGPYAFWHHKHFLREIDGGVEMEDLIHYKLPFGVLGRIVNAVMVKKQLTEIFDYRYKKIEEMFGVMR